MMQPGQLVEHLPALRAYARFLTRSHVEAEDLLQSTALHALEKAHLFAADTNLGGWLSTMMHSLHVSRGRRGSKRAAKEEAGWTCMAPAAMGDGYAAALLSEVRAALMRLPPHARDAIAAVAAGHEYEEHAAARGLPLGTVRSRLSRGRALLREMTQ